MAAQLRASSDSGANLEKQAAVQRLWRPIDKFAPHQWNGGYLK